MNRLVIPSPAKINLFLKVVGKRPNGYHEIITLLSRVGLFDTVVLTFDQPSISVDCSHPRVPQDSTNLAHRAASLFFEALSKHDGIAIFIDKVIPVAAGLGGGSSNAAAVLMGLNQHYGLPFTKRELMDIGVKVGADVPFFLFGHAAVARGIGDDLEAYEDLPPLSVVLVCPKFEVSTAWVYKNLNLRLTNCEKNFRNHKFEEGFSKVKDLLCNDLEQVTIRKFPEIKTIKKALLNLGAESALMSGSGPSVFGLFRDTQQAKKAIQAIRHQGRWNAFLAALLLP
ncbi:MAG: 4-(cytidine 5'-diphospho)-2-C-methyl-D-erythritol kinase [Deltaproteobacteria bacterium]|nr:4-(cytidine 5'-diphospho)-2-C-methyl-D-erythritol kinase [Deltaproteobacteria bacterium]MBW2019314.1 4-(cytidine 5'-diphospho)-2-C-methyl-D-erythritol kinase [Deltaproteobacteria bacterium]MBW2074362.1 4-(cytidine 5'-diphospho)-2-C-methyl-D-erythritol kinase [Deltaproteobacteria bacterium]RLB82294.1 MAG: 4-(cytidine 5'-diphospho)-2-C-methyl-D-erythritol kinase [Deltaproteobacteria bacterium]